MENMKIKMVKCYEENSASNSFILGFSYKHNVYAIKTSEKVALNYTKLGVASRNQGYNLRFRPTTLDKLELINMGARIIGSENLVEDGKYNKGENFEKFITESYGQTWVKDSTPWWADGDITVDGEKIQIKYEDASFMTEKHLARFE